MFEKEMKKKDLQELGISRSTIAKFEKREYVALEVIDRLCAHFGVQPDQIIEHVPEEKTNE